MMNLEQTIAKTFLQMAEGLESGSFGKRPKIALTGMGSEHGEENAIEAAVLASRKGVDVYYIGSLTAEGVTTVPVANEEEGHKKMEEMVESGEVDGAVTMHFPFPIGVSTVGRVITPAKGREMFIATTTGTGKDGKPITVKGLIDKGAFDFSKTENDLYIIGILNKYDGDTKKADQYLKDTWGADYEQNAEAYKIKDIFAGKYHGDGPDLTAEIKTYVNKMKTSPAELKGCVEVDKRLAEILQMLMEKYTFENVDNAWLKVCYYYDYMG